MATASNGTSVNTLAATPRLAIHAGTGPQMRRFRPVQGAMAANVQNPNPASVLL